MSVALGASDNLYLDEAILVRATQLYTNGPFVGFFENQRALQSTDRYSIAVSNNRGGRLQTRFGRIYGRQLPSSGSPTISD